MGKLLQNKKKGNFSRSILLKSLIFTGVIAIGYIGLFIIQTNQPPKLLKEVETDVSEHYFTLLENRLALTGLSQLSTDSLYFSGQHQDLIGKLAETNEEELKSISKQIEPSNFFFPTTNKFKVYNSDISILFTALLKKSKDLLEKQRLLIKEIEDFDQIVSNIYSYDPVVDLGSLDFQGEDTDIVERSKAAIEGLKGIMDGLGKAEIEQKKIIILSREINNTIGLFDEVILQIQNAKFNKAQTARNELIKQFGKLKEITYEIEVSLIKTTVSIGLLVEQAEILVEYQSLLDKISKSKPKQVVIKIGSEIGKNGYRQIFYIKNNKKKFITKGDYTSASPKTDRSYITWMSQVGSSWQIFRYHIVSEKTMKLATSGNNVDPDISNGKIVWQKWLGDTWQIFLFNGYSVSQISDGVAGVSPYFDKGNIYYTKKNKSGKQKLSKYSLEDLRTKVTQDSVKEELR